MINYFDENYDSEAIAAEAADGRNLFNNKRAEYALATFVYPNGDYRYRIGWEARFIDSSVEESDEWQITVELLAIHP